MLVPVTWKTIEDIPPDIMECMLQHVSLEDIKYSMLHEEVRPGVYLCHLNSEHYIQDTLEDRSRIGREKYFPHHPRDKNGKRKVPINFDWQEGDSLETAPLHIMSEKFNADCHNVDYGVCDNHEQILAAHPLLEESDEPLVVLMTPILKKHEPERDGWRWSKWGPYIGEQEPQCEYLHDEPKIEMVYVYSVFVVTEPYQPQESTP